jgi:hypothetical protein
VKHEEIGRNEIGVRCGRTVIARRDDAAFHLSYLISRPASDGIGDRATANAAPSLRQAGRWSCW